MKTIKIDGREYKVFPKPSENGYYWISVDGYPPSVEYVSDGEVQVIGEGIGESPRMVRGRRLVVLSKVLPKPLPVSEKEVDVDRYEFIRRMSDKDRRDVFEYAMRVSREMLAGEYDGEEF